MPEVTIKNCEPQPVVALRHQGDYALIGGAFERLCGFASANGLFEGSVRSFGIYYDDPAIRIPLRGK